MYASYYFFVISKSGFRQKFLKLELVFNIFFLIKFKNKKLHRVLMLFEL